jgi:hypothetical protein
MARARPRNMSKPRRLHASHSTYANALFARTILGFAVLELDTQRFTVRFISFRGEQMYEATLRKKHAATWRRSGGIFGRHLTCRFRRLGTDVMCNCEGEDHLEGTSRSFADRDSTF